MIKLRNVNTYILYYFICGFSLCSFVGVVEAQPNIFLKIETGTHHSKINTVSTDETGKYAITSSSDLTVRVWDLATGQPTRIIRPAVLGENHQTNQDAKITSSCISSFKKIIAVGAYSGISDGGIIYIYSAVNGILLKVLSGFPFSPTDLQFSPDGNFLAVVFEGGEGLQVYDTKDYSLTFKDDDYQNKNAFQLTFSSFGFLAVSSLSYLTLYDSEYHIVRKIKVESLASKDSAHENSIPYGLAFSPNGSKLAVGYLNAYKLDVFSGLTLEFQHTVNTSDLNNEMENSNMKRTYIHNKAVAWSMDGEFLLSSGNMKKKSHDFIRKWSNKGKGKYEDILLTSSEDVQEMIGLHNGNTLYISNNSLALISDIGKNILYIKNQSIEYHKKYNFELSYDATSLMISNSNVSSQLLGSPVIFSLKKGFIQKNNLKAEAFHKVSGKMGRYALTLPENKGRVGIPKNEVRLVSHKYSNWKVKFPSDIEGINNSIDGSILVVALKDGTFRWLRTSDGKLLLSLFLHSDGKKWVAWTPEGFFSHSKKTRGLIGFEVVYGEKKVTKFITIDKLYDQLYRPELIIEALNIKSKAVNLAAKSFKYETLLASGLAPLVSFVSPHSGGSSKRDVEVILSLTEQDGGLGKVEWKLNGMTVGVTTLGRGIIVRSNTASPFTLKLSRTLTLVPGSNTIKVVAYSKMGVASTPATLKLNLKDAISEKPALYILAVGVNQYRDRTLRLNYAVPDAQSLTSSLQRSGTPIFTGVHVTKVYNSQATRDGIKAAFAKIAAISKSNDVFIFYLAGHGITLDGRYHFLPSDFRYVNENSVRTSSINQDDLQRWMADISAMKNLVLLDTCNSGSFVKAQTATRGLAEKTAITKLIRATGRAVISASTDTQVALEGYKGHGVFTWAFIQAMEQADNQNGNKDGITSTAEIASFINEQVPDLTYKKWGYEQIPQVNLHGREFPVGVVVP